jgi:hypothetical protein
MTFSTNLPQIHQGEQNLPTLRNLSILSELIHVSEEGVHGALVALGVEHELGVVVLTLLEADDLIEVGTGALGEALVQLEEAGGISVGASVDAGGVAAEIVDSGVANGLEVLVHDLRAAVVVSVEGRNNLVAGVLSNLFSVLEEFSDVTLNVAGSTLEIALGLVGWLFVKLELASAVTEASLVKTVLPGLGVFIKLIGPPALDCALSIANT